MKTGDYQKALRRIAALESETALIDKLISHAIEAWEAHLQIAESTRTKYFRLLRQLEEWAKIDEILLVRELNLEALDRFYTSHTVARTTRVREIQTLRSFFGFCLKRRWCAENPAAEMEMPKGLKPNEVIPYTHEEIGVILAACDRVGQQSYERQRAKALILLMRHTALRISDALRLRKDQVNGYTLMLFTKKTGGQILLPIPPELKSALDSLPLPNPNLKDNGYYFWNGHSNHHAMLNEAERLLGSVFRKSGVRDSHAHRFRHTVATEILGKGGTLSQVADVLGISEFVARKHYAKWSSDRQDQVWRIMTAIQQPISIQKVGTKLVQSEQSDRKLLKWKA